MAQIKCFNMIMTTFCLAVNMIDVCTYLHACCCMNQWHAKLVVTLPSVWCSQVQHICLLFCSKCLFMWKETSYFKLQENLFINILCIMLDFNLKAISITYQTGPYKKNPIKSCYFCTFQVDLINQVRKSGG